MSLYILTFLNNSPNEPYITVNYGLRDAPLSENQYERLLKGITSQTPWQTLITWLCNNYHNTTTGSAYVTS